MSISAEQVFMQSIKRITGIGADGQALGGTVIEAGGDGIQKEISDMFRHIIDPTVAAPDNADLMEQYNAVKDLFVSHYEQEENRAFLEARADTVVNGTDPETVAKAITEIWAPEVAMTEEETFKRWQITDVKPNPDPYKPEEVILPLNAMYGLPENIPADLPQDIKDEWDRVKDAEDDVFFDYDHPVVLFSPDDNHELVSCLRDLETDMAFEKSQGTYAADYRLIVPVSVSVTHPRIDRLTGMWLTHILKEKKYEHLRVYILTEENVVKLRKAIGFSSSINAIFSVIGKYGNHFNVLKYFQLLLEKTDGIRASFKLDTDEGARSEDLKKATGKTWFATMCHKYWGATAVNADGKEIYLGVNEGEYINEKDINDKGYAACLREPDVKVPQTYIDSTIFFNKGFAHAQATALYNKKVNSVDDCISHPVVKGGGYGIDNEALRRFVPFTFSEVGRAEDQQFYLAGLAKGNAGIFTPDLRIAHYKMSAATTEHTTEVSRFVGDLYRLVIFQHIVDFLGVKDAIDPMPGVFAGTLARVQAFFNLMYKSYSYLAGGQTEMGETLYRRGLKEIGALKRQIDAGEIRRRWDEEQAEWKKFVAAADAADPAAVKTVLEDIGI